jgi:hypothetical protein
MPNDEMKENISKLLKVFDTSKIISPDEIKEVLTAIMAVLAKNKKEVEDLTAETKELVSKVINEVADSHNKHIELVKGDTVKSRSDIEKSVKEQTDRAFKRLQNLISKIRMPEDGKPGKDANPADIVPLVLEQIKQPEVKEFVLTPQDIKNKLSELEDDEKDEVFVFLGSRKITNLEATMEIRFADALNRIRLTRGVHGIIAGTGITTSVDGNGNVTINSTGSPGGSDTQIQFNDGGVFGGDAGLTYNKTTNLLTIDSGGLVINQSSSLTGIDLIGAGTTTTLFNAYSNTVRTSGVLFNINEDNSSSSASVVSINNDGTGKAIFIDNNNTGRALEIDHDANSASAITGLFVNVANAGAGAAYAAIFEAGWVGIGTTTPTAPLHISQNADVNSFNIVNPGQSTTGTALLMTIPLSTSLTTGKAFGTIVSGESFGRAIFYSDGKYGIGPGSGTRDVFLSRSGTNTLRISSDGTTGAADISITRNILVGTGAVGTSGAGVLVLTNGTVPSTSPADVVQLFSSDISAGNATLGLRTETAVASDAALASTHSLTIKINGANYKLMLVSA